jgi:hypothetical protein
MQKGTIRKPRTFYRLLKHYNHVFGFFTKQGTPLYNRVPLCLVVTIEQMVYKTAEATENYNDCSTMNDLTVDNDDNDDANDSDASDEISWSWIFSPSTPTHEHPTKHPPSAGWIWDDRAIQTSWKDTLACRHLKDIALGNSVCGHTKNKISEPLPLYLSKNTKISLQDCAYNADINIINKHSCTEREHHTNTATNQYGQYAYQEYQEDDRHAIVHFLTNWNPKTLTIPASDPVSCSGRG